MPTGIIKWFNREKKFGFIRNDDGGKDIFFHGTQWLGAGDDPTEGDHVTFDIGPNKKRPDLLIAFRVTPVSKEGALDEVEFMRKRALAAGVFVARHRDHDPARGGGEFFMQHRKVWEGEWNSKSILKFATAAQINAALDKIESGEISIP